ncbi:PP0621 family protein [Nitrosomonas sp.]|uniref:PP0621 family protein n=1 Tax=Nitrosomonas sp. TaxID=42353 RepID=UPI00345588EF
MMSYEKRAIETDMGKLIFYILIAVLIYWIIKSRQSKQKDKEVEVLPESAEDMVNCSYCGVYLPKSEAVGNHDKYFCCNEHSHLYINSSS